MTDAAWCLNVSNRTVWEYHVLLILASFIFLLEVYFHHISRLDLPKSSVALGVKPWMYMFRVLFLLSSLANGIFGMVTARKITLFKLITYLLVNFMLILHTCSTFVSRFIFLRSLEFHTDMMLHQIWLKNEMGTLESRFDCCGRNGISDYRQFNRTLSIDTCCELEECYGCAQFFKDFVNVVEYEIGRDNLILCIMLIIAFILMLLYFSNIELVDDPYDIDERIRD